VFWDLNRDLEGERRKRKIIKRDEEEKEC